MRHGAGAELAFISVAPWARNENALRVDLVERFHIPENAVGEIMIREAGFTRHCGPFNSGWAIVIPSLGAGERFENGARDEA